MKTIKEIWNNKTPVYIRELFYAVFGVAVLALIMQISPVLNGWVIAFAIWWGLGTITEWIGDGLKSLVEPKYIDSQYGIPRYQVV